MTTFNILFALALLIHAIYTTHRITKQLHMMQLNSYRNLRYWKWLTSHLTQGLILKDLLPLIVVIPLSLIKRWTWHAMPLQVLSIWILIYALLYAFRSREKAKKPLVFTARAKRLLFTNLILLGAAYVISALLIEKLALWALLSTLAALTFFTPFLMLISNLLIHPVESYINHWYYQDARKKLAKFPHLKIIGITGSFGKTTTKYALHEILKQKYHVLITPGSFNTTMGVIKVIREQLKPIHEVFIVEMGAKQRGDIKEICDLVKPQYGILTAIGPQHLDTFGDIETIKRTKNELIESLPDNGVAFFNLDNEHCRELSTLTQKKMIGFSTTPHVILDHAPGSISANNIAINNIQINGLGSTFSACATDGTSETFETKLLGEHNLSNIAGAMTIAYELGLSLSEIKPAIKHLQPILHRLNLKRIQNDMIIIDDAFNSNPVGSKMALDVLKKMPGNQKIIVTPGMIDLGDKSDQYNQEFGQYISQVCDYVILVGPNQTKPIQEGLKQAHFPEKHCFIAQNLEVATKHLWTIVQPNAVILFENDLPDNYAE